MVAHLAVGLVSQSENEVSHGFLCGSPVSKVSYWSVMSNILSYETSTDKFMHE